MAAFPVVIDVDECRYAKLPKVCHALELIGVLARPTERWEEDGDQERDDPYDHEQLDKRKSTAVRRRGDRSIDGIAPRPDMS